ncbi:hypothetical protein [Blautia sp.]|uniref:hypothetical protein n=1 Tax=Blautia sp. TaxID=1955243 RepID=UPI003993B1EA
MWKTLLLPVIVYGVFLIICFKRFNNLNCVYTIFLQSIVPTITAYAYAFIYMSGLFDLPLVPGSSSADLSEALPRQVRDSRTSDWGAGGKRNGSGAHRILNWICKIPSLILTMALTMIFEIMGKNISGKFSFVSIDYKYAALDLRHILLLYFSYQRLCSILYLIIQSSVSYEGGRGNEAVSRNAGYTYRE